MYLTYPHKRGFTIISYLHTSGLPAAKHIVSEGNRELLPHRRLNSVGMYTAIHAKYASVLHAYPERPPLKRRYLRARDLPALPRHVDEEPTAGDETLEAPVIMPPSVGSAGPRCTTPPAWLYNIISMRALAMPELPSIWK